MNASQISPKLLKGALVSLKPHSAIPGVIIFQYNPASLTRTLKAKTSGGGADRGEVLRIQGPPEETLTLDVELDAVDQLELGNPVTLLSGLHPALATLELLLYPPSQSMIANETLAAAGIIEIIPPEAPLTLLVWGMNRIVPVRLTDFSISEEEFDPLLNPIRARVGLGLRVLTYDDLGLASKGGSIFMAHQVGKETLSKIVGRAQTLASIGLNLGG